MLTAQRIEEPKGLHCIIHMKSARRPVLQEVDSGAGRVLTKGARAAAQLQKLYRNHNISFSIERNMTSKFCCAGIFLGTSN